MLLDYGVLMAKHGEWASEPEEKVVRADLRFRPPEWMAQRLKEVVAVEDRVRALQGKRGTSINRELEFVVERYLIGYQEEYGMLPTEKDAGRLDSYAAGVVAKREAAKKKK